VLQSAAVMRTLALVVALTLFALTRAARAQEAPPPPPSKVVVGAYLNDVQSLDLKLHSYAIDIYIWFRWTDPDLPSPATTMEFVNPSELWGHAQSASYEEPVTLPSGERYQVVRVQGRFSQKLPLDHYPFDRQTLTVTFEDGQREAAFLTYEADAAGIVVNPDLILPGYRMQPARLSVSEYVYPTGFGDTRHARANVYSRAVVEVPIARPVVSSMIKFLLPVLCVVLCAALMLVLRPTYVDARIGIGITALLTIVALQITTNDDLPNVDYLILMDKVYVMAYVYVIAGLGVVVRTTRLIDRDGQVGAETLQRRALVGLTGLFSLGFILLVAHAILG
jgi:hypothetical protein